MGTRVADSTGLARRRFFWDTLRSTYWFAPLFSSIVAIGLARGMVALDAAVPDRLLVASPFVYIGAPESERATLLTLATSVLGTAGVVFSLTAVPLSVAASQFGSRLLRNFLRDATTQGTLAIYCATFVYCLVVLFALPETGSPSSSPAEAPHLATTGAFLLAVACFASLIFFVHNVGASLQAPVLIDEVADDLERAIDAFARAARGIGASARELPAKTSLVSSESDGYVQFIDYARLASLAQSGDFAVRVRVAPGDRVVSGQTFLEHGGAGFGDASLRGCLVVGSRRIPVQDVAYGIRQLVEVAVRALSPAVNDPFTAINCLDRLGSLLTRASGCGFGQADSIASADGVARVTFAPPFPFDALAADAFDMIRQYGRGCAEILLHLLLVIEQAALESSGENRVTLLGHAETVVAEADSGGLPNPSDRDRVRARYAELVNRCDLK